MKCDIKVGAIHLRYNSCSFDMNLNARKALTFYFSYLFCKMWVIDFRINQYHIGLLFGKHFCCCCPFLPNCYFIGEKCMLVFSRQLKHIAQLSNNVFWEE